MIIYEYFIYQIKIILKLLDNSMHIDYWAIFEFR